MRESVPEETPYHVALRIDHPFIRAEEISEALGLEPNSSHSAGLPRRTPDGLALEGTYSATYWIHRFGEFEELEGGIEVCLTVLDKRALFLERIRKEEGRVQVLVRKHRSDTNGFELEWETLKRMADARVAFGFEVIVGSI
jgi:hypothetical protein